MSGSIDWGVLKAAAVAVRDNAYAPYSGFNVGAAVLADGRIFVGCNAESASFPVGICAERAALSAAISAGCRSIQAVAVAADRLVTPCGMCRQALCEFNREVPILMASGDEEERTTLDQLLPDPFG